MDRISVMILEHNCEKCMPLFLARLTQRGQNINDMYDISVLKNEALKDYYRNGAGKSLLKLPHTTLHRMNYITIAITGLSTKAVSQLRTHAKRLTFVSTSTQYSSFENRPDNFVIPDDSLTEQFEVCYDTINNMYNDMLKAGVNKDIASYILPQGLRKALVISGNIDDWNYVLKTRLCNRNTKEVQQIACMIYNEIVRECGAEWVQRALPDCHNGGCNEGKMCCGKRFDKSLLEGE